MPELEEQTNSPQRLNRVRVYLRQRPVMLVALTAFAVVFFLFVGGLTHAYKDQRSSLGNRWFERGVAELNAKRYEAAVRDFRAALLYSRDDYAYQLNLAEALLGMKHTGEASAYFLNLWDRQPEDGLVNLELARIAAQKGQTQQAVRYYHDAVYAIWPREQESQRRDARLELVNLLLQNNAKPQAQAELIARSETVTEDPVEQRLLGELFLRADDPQHALREFDLSLKEDPRDSRALAGAGYAAYELGQYPLAQRYLEDAVKKEPKDTQSAERLQVTEMVLRMDPFRRQLSMQERNRLVIQAFAIAGKRLEQCGVPSGDAGSATTPQADLSGQWSAMKPQVTERALQTSRDLTDRAMDLVFQIERQTSTSCGAPAGPDLALFLISKLHEGNPF